MQECIHESQSMCFQPLFSNLSICIYLYSYTFMIIYTVERSYSQKKNPNLFYKLMSLLIYFILYFIIIFHNIILI